MCTHHTKKIDKAPCCSRPHFLSYIHASMHRNTRHLHTHNQLAPLLEQDIELQRGVNSDTTTQRRHNDDNLHVIENISFLAVNQHRDMMHKGWRLALFFLFLWLHSSLQSEAAGRSQHNHAQLHKACRILECIYFIFGAMLWSSFSLFPLSSSYKSITLHELQIGHHQTRSRARRP